MAKSVFWGEEYFGVLSGGLAALFIIGSCLTVAAFFPPISRPDKAKDIAPLIVAVGILLSARLWMSWKSRHWLTAQDEEFVYSHCGVNHRISENKVSDVGIAENVVRLPKITHLRRRIRFAFQVGKETKELIFEHETSSKEEDSIGTALQQTVENLAKRTLQQLQDGETITGEGWTLRREELSIDTDGESTTVRINEIVAVDWVDNAVCVWLSGHAEPMLRKDATSPRATVLYRVLKELVRKPPRATPSAAITQPKPTTRPEPATSATGYPPGGSSVRMPRDSIPRAEAVPIGMSSTPVGDELGRLIFEREAGATKKEMRSHLLWLLVAGPLGSIWILAGLAGVAGLGTAKQQSASFAGLIFGPLLIAGGALPLLLQWRKMGCLFQCHENGLVYKERSRTRKLLYRDVGSFTYAVVQQFINGGYAFTGGVMTFEHRDPKKKPIEYRWASQYEDEEINRLRDHISGVLAGHMLRRLKEGQPVRWTTHWTFMPKGLYILRDGKGEGPGNARTTPYDHLTRHKFKEGVFYLSPKDDTQVEENASEPNFFPGYFLLLLLTPAPAETTVPAINKLKKPG